MPGVLRLHMLLHLLLIELIDEPDFGEDVHFLSFFFIPDLSQSTTTVGNKWLTRERECVGVSAEWTVGKSVIQFFFVRNSIFYIFVFRREKSLLSFQGQNLKQQVNDGC